MPAIAKSILLRASLFYIGPSLTIVFGWSATSIAISFLFAVIATLLHLYYRHIYVSTPVFLIRVASFTAIQLVLAAMVRSHEYSGPTGFIPKLDESPVIPMADKIASDFLSSQPVVTMSIVLPCANEGRFSWLTAESLADLTPDEVLKEIIVVDDGSTPPLATQFPPDIVKKAKVRFVRHESHTGLINAKAAGANVATGDVVVFLDCHVKPAPGWDKPITDKIRTNYRRVVVPSITGLDPDTWTEVRGNGGTAKCYLTWDSDFKWFDSDDEYVAVMSGGLLAMSRQWWIETGGYDTSMKGWGGENIDQSLRIWLCHGEIVQATTSFVGHMWRTHDKPETRARYTVPPGSVIINRYRGASVWMGDWRDKLETYPEFSRYKTARPDVTSIQTVKDRLQCKDFSYFIDKFYKVYHWAGLLPKEVFHLRDANSGLCLQRSYSGSVILTQCSDSDAGQKWHRSNRDGNTCCSGYRNWNTDQCISSGWIGGKASTHVCNVGGISHDQYIQLNPKTKQLELTKRRGACLGGELVPRPRAQFDHCRSENSANHQLFKKIVLSQPGADEELVRFEDAARPGLCLAALGGSESTQGRIEAHDCDPKSPLQQFALSKAEDGKKLRVEAAGLTAGEDGGRLCLDAGLGTNEIGLYPCYSNSNLNQDAKIVSEPGSSDSIRIEFKDSYCVAVPIDKSDDSDNKALELHGCVSDGAVLKRGQAFEKVFPQANDKTVFALRNRDGACVSINSEHHFVLSKSACEKDLFKQEPGDVHKRLKHLPSNLCFDGNNGVTPVLYTCYEGENTNQQIDVSEGTIKLERTETCIDFEPVKPSPVTAIPCSVAESAFRWEEYKPFIPIETEIYNRKKGPVPPADQGDVGQA
jgi:glycosyltransferase involved in cell wall biosynthesis